MFPSCGLSRAFNDAFKQLTKIYCVSLSCGLYCFLLINQVTFPSPLFLLYIHLSNCFSFISALLLCSVSHRASDTQAKPAQYPPCVKLSLPSLNCSSKTWFTNAVSVSIHSNLSDSFSIEVFSFAEI